MAALMFVPDHDPDGDHGDEADDEGGGGDEGRPRQPRGGWVIRAGGASPLGILRLGTDLLVEESLAGVAAGDGDGGGRHPPRRRTRVVRGPLGGAAVELGGAPVLSGRVGLSLLVHHLPSVSFGIWRRRMKDAI